MLAYVLMLAIMPAYAFDLMLVSPFQHLQLCQLMSWIQESNENYLSAEVKEQIYIVRKENDFGDNFDEKLKFR